MSTPTIFDSSRSSPAPLRFLGEYPDPRHHEDVDQVGLVRHFAAADGSSVVHLLDAYGRLHRTDGPAVVSINPRSLKSRWSTAHYANGHRIDGESSAPVRLPHDLRTPEGIGLDPNEASAMTLQLPTGSWADEDGYVHAPWGIARMFTEEDILLAWVYATRGDPLVHLAKELAQQLSTGASSKEG